MARVLFLAARDDLYGASRALLSHVRRLSAYGVVPLVLTPRVGPLSEALAAEGVEVETAPVLASSRSVKSRLLAPFRLRAVADLASRREVRLIVGSTLSAAPSARHLARMLRVPWILHLRSTYVGRGQASAPTRYGAQHADLIIAVSRAVLDEYERLVPCDGRQVRRVVHDGIETAVVRPRDEARRVLGLPEDAVVAGILGAVTPRKATGFAAQVAERAGVLLGVLGEGQGSELEAVRASSASRLLGFREDATELLAAFDLLLHPARQEAFGLAPIEAMAAGVPVLASDVEGLREVAGDAALLLEPGRLDTWVEATRCVLEHAELRASLVTRGRARSAELTADASARQVAAVYLEWLEGRPA